MLWLCLCDVVVVVVCCCLLFVVVCYLLLFVICCCLLSCCVVFCCGCCGLDQTDPKFMKEMSSRDSTLLREHTQAKSALDRPSLFLHVRIKVLLSVNCTWSVKWQEILCTAKGWEDASIIHRRELPREREGRHNRIDWRLPGVSDTKALSAPTVSRTWAN